MPITTQKAPRRLTLTAAFAALAAAVTLTGCATEKQYPGGDNDDSRKAPAPVASAASPAPAASPAAAAADAPREKAGSTEPGGK